MPRLYRTLFLLAVVGFAIANRNGDLDDGGDDDSGRELFTSTLISVAGAAATTAISNPGSTDYGERGEDDDGLAGPHGVLGGIAFVIMFPLGGMIIRLMQNSLWKHAGWMLLAYALALATLGTGIVLAQKEGDLNEEHSIVGILVITGLFLQPFTGYVHHKLFVKTGGRTAVSYAHMWIGIPIITLGIVNGLLGLKLAEKATYVLVIYAVVAAIIWVIWLASSIWMVRRRKRQADRQAQNINGVRMRKLQISSEESRLPDQGFYAPTDAHSRV